MSLAEPAALPVATSAAPRLHLLKRFTSRFKASLPAYLLLLPSLVFLALFTYWRDGARADRCALSARDAEGPGAFRRL
ncbi:hypothetical protein ABIA03_006474 [Bradyrhizobium yuanmingense]|uniref:ABC transporter permease n=1 Tax=Bradyrhizobium yuanmingense TaxID=108015 RepID=A0ABV4GU18_9BRAD